MNLTRIIAFTRNLTKLELYRPAVDKCDICAARVVIEIISIWFPKNKKNEVIRRLEDSSSWKHTRLMVTTTDPFQVQNESPGILWKHALIPIHHISSVKY